MNAVSITKEIEPTAEAATRGKVARGWLRWTPVAAVAWSLVYAALALYWAISGRGFPLTPLPGSEITGPIAGRFGPVVAWIIVAAAGLPAAALGALMLRNVKKLRVLLIAAGGVLAVVLLLLMSDVLLLSMLGYTPQGLAGLIAGNEAGDFYLQLLTMYKWTLAHELLCTVGGFFWLGSTVSYARRSGDACLSCGRGEAKEGWTSPKNAAKWCRIAVFVSISVPILYAITRYAYVLGIPLGISENYLRIGQESGM